MSNQCDAHKKLEVTIGILNGYKLSNTLDLSQVKLAGDLEISDLSEDFIAPEQTILL